MALAVLSALGGFWLVAAVSWWRGGRRSWLWGLAPFVVLGLLFVGLVAWEVAFGVP